MSSISAPFRVNAPIMVSVQGLQPAAGPNAAALPSQPGGTAIAQGGDPWLTRLVKLIPAEIIAVYLAGYELAGDFVGWWAFTCLVLVFVSRIWGTKEGDKPVQWFAVLVSAFSFIIWIYAMGDYFFSWRLSEDFTGIPSLVVLVWTFVIPYFYKGDQ